MYPMFARGGEGNPRVVALGGARVRLWPMASPPKSKLGRLARLGGLTSRMTSAYVGSRLASAFQDEDARHRTMSRLHLENAERMVETVGRLKGAAMKVGQSVALVAGTLDLPDELRSMLGRLHDQAPPVPFGVIREDVERSLDLSLERAFSWFDPEPLGTASLGQAHAARLPDGQEVVVKVLHRGIENSVASDLGALKAMLVGGRVLRRDKAEIEARFEEIRARLEEELDYLQEAVNVASFQRIFGDDPDLRIPRVHTTWSTERVLTLDRIPGVPLERFLETATPDARQRAGFTLGSMFYRMVYRHRTLHADPHPGNYLFEPDGRIGLLDYGCVKRYDEFWTGTYARAALAGVAGDRDACLAGVRSLGAWRGDTPEAGDALWAFCELLVHPYRVDRPYELGGPDDDWLFDQIPAVMRRLVRYPEIQAPPEMLFLHRTLGGLYAIQRRLRPRFEWFPLLEENARYAIDLAEGRIS